MAATKTKYSSLLPKVSNITIGSSVSKRGTVAFTGENGKLGTAYVYFKQPGTKYPYQIQYRTRSHYTEENQKKKGAEWTKWSAWKNGRLEDTFTSPVLGTVNPKATQEKAPMRQWMKGNRGTNKKSKYQKAFNLTGHGIASTYDGREWELRIRTVNKAKARHGKLVYGKVTVWKRTAIVDERAFVAKDAGLDIRFQFKGSDEGTTVVNSIKDSNGAEILKAQFKGAKLTWTYDNYSNVSARSGYTPAKTAISRSMLTRDIAYGENLTCDIVFTNEHKAPTPFKLTGVNTMDTSLKEGISIELDKNSDIGGLIVKVNDSQAAYDAIDGVWAKIFYTDKNGKDKSLTAFCEKKVLDGSSTQIGTFYFLPPYNVPLKINVGLYSRYGSSCGFEQTLDAQFNSGKYTLLRQWIDTKDVDAVNSWMLGKIGKNTYEYTQIAEAYDKVELSVSTSQENIYLNPLGEKKAWGATSGAAPTTTLSFSANVMDKDIEDTACQKKVWESMREGIGSYFCLRTPYGEVYTILLDSMSLSKTAPYIYSVAFRGTEIGNTNDLFNNDAKALMGV